MSRGDDLERQPTLFDVDGDGEDDGVGGETTTAVETPAKASPGEGAPATPRSSLADVDLGSDPVSAAAAGPARGPREEPSSEAGAVGPKARLWAGLVDVAVHAGVLLVVSAGLWSMGVVPGVDAVPALVALAAVFSLFYTVIPLAFWGQTPGMAALGLVARCDGEPLTFGQATVRWLVGLLSVVTLGLPTLVALGGRSLADRLTDSDVVRRTSGSHG